jgi:3'-phosphoadenosine 5'-phosphosulfate sulfotransferase (PAPS reductase)/FAD synthetase
MPITFDGVGSHWPASATIRQQYVESDEKLILSFSRGKDSITAWLAMLESGIKPENIIPVYYYRIPGLQFTADSLDYFEQIFQTRIIRMPHPSLFRMWNEMIFQPPTRSGIIEAAQMPQPSYQDIEQLLRQDLELPDSTYVATGVRAADSIQRRTFIKKSGPITHTKKRVAIVWDWTKGECYDYIAKNGVELPVDYQLFEGKQRRSGRTFDGLAAQFLGPIRDNLPDDYARILEWFPVADIDLFRHEQLANEGF